MAESHGHVGARGRSARLMRVGSIGARLGIGTWVNMGSKRRIAWMVIRWQGEWCRVGSIGRSVGRLVGPGDGPPIAASPRVMNSMHIYIYIYAYSTVKELKD
jgi:hypothetical protein